MESFMGRPIGSTNREKPFNDALRIALRGDPLRLRRIAEKLAEKAEDGDLAAIRELADRLDGKPPQAHTGEGGDVTVIIRTITAWDEEEPPPLLEHEPLGK
jgi:hypothetical protein